MNDSEDEEGTENKGYTKAHEWEIRALVWGISATWEPVLYTVIESMVIEILMVMFHY